MRVLWRGVRRVRSLYTALAGAVLAVSAFGDRIDALRQSSAWTYLYVVVDLFKVELLAVVVAVAFGPLILADAREAGRWLSAAGRVRLRVKVLLAALCVVSLGWGTWQAAMYVVGKQLQLKRYPRMLLARAAEGFAEGGAAKAARPLGVCADLLRTFSCLEAKAKLEDRQKAARRLRELDAGLRQRGLVLAVLAEDAYRLDHDAEAYREQQRAVVGERERRVQAYVRALEATLQERGSRSSELLRTIVKEEAWLGDAHLVLEETGRCPGESPVDGQQCPYLARLQQVGAPAFAAEVVRPLRHRDVAELRQRVFWNEPRYIRSPLWARLVSVLREMRDDAAGSFAWLFGQRYRR